MRFERRHGSRSAAGDETESMDGGQASSLADKRKLSFAEYTGRWLVGGLVLSVSGAFLIDRVVEKTGGLSQKLENATKEGRTLRGDLDNKSADFLNASCAAVLQIERMEKAGEKFDRHLNDIQAEMRAAGLVHGGDNADQTTPSTTQAPHVPELLSKFIDACK